MIVLHIYEGNQTGSYIDTIGTIDRLYIDRKALNLFIDS